MDRESVLELLRRVKSGKTAPDQAAEEIAGLPFEAIGDALVDHHRAVRTDLPQELREVEARAAAHVQDTVTGFDRERLSNQAAATNDVARAVHGLELLSRALVEHEMAHGSRIKALGACQAAASDRAR